MPVALTITENGVKTAAAVVGAVGTVSAVVLALYRDTIREWLQRPRLTLTFEGPPVDATSVEVRRGPMGTNHLPSHWLRLQVTNEGKRRSAHDVRVLITAVHRLEPDGQVRLPLDTVALIWSNRERAEETSEIPPSVGRRIDVANLNWPSQPGAQAEPNLGPAECTAVLQVIPTPSAARNVLPAGRYLLDLAVTATDVEAQRFQVELLVDGEWYPDERVGGTSTSRA